MLQIIQIVFSIRFRKKSHFFYFLGSVQSACTCFASDDKNCASIISRTYNSVPTLNCSWSKSTGAEKGEILTCLSENASSCFIAKLGAEKMEASNCPSENVSSCFISKVTKIFEWSGSWFGGSEILAFEEFVLTGIIFN